MRAPSVAVVIPAFREERLIANTIASVPKDVAQIIVVDDGSDDDTGGVARRTSDRRVTVLKHPENRGVGAAIYSGYQEALRGSADIFVVMAGDNQMDGRDLPQLVAPLLCNQAEYVKGNRLIHPEFRQMPRLRRYGSILLSSLTSWAAGTSWGDTQCGYTAISRKAAQALNYADLWPRYGYPNDLLIALAQDGARVVETKVRPVYATEESGLRAWHILSIIRVILRRVLLAKLRKSAPRLSLDDGGAL